MDSLQVVRPLVCTSRKPGLAKASLREQSDGAGAYAEAVDTVGARDGNWVFVVCGFVGWFVVGVFGVLFVLFFGGFFVFWVLVVVVCAGSEVKAARNSRTNLTD